MSSSQFESGRIAPARILELAFVFTAVCGLAGLALGLIGCFDSIAVLLLSAIATVIYAYWVPKFDLPQALLPKGRHLLLVLLVAGLFRSTPYYYVLGGQDQGIYVNVAAELVRTGDIPAHDDMPRLLGEKDLVEAYSRSHLSPGHFAPGVYRVGDSDDLQFQFYHLFPTYMAVVGGAIGLKHSVYALTVLSLLGVAFFYWLALALTESRRAAFVAGMLLAINPLHVFFSKFPVTEVPTLLFSAAALTWLAVYWRSPADSRSPRLVVFSVLAMACLFATRMTGFMYVPFVVVSATLAFALDVDARRAKGVLAWAIATCMVYAVSVLYGLRWSRQYAMDHYAISFKGILGEQWASYLSLGLPVLALAWIALLISSFQVRSIRAFLSQTVVLGRRWLGVILFLTLLVALYKAYQLGFTDRHVEDAVRSGRWGMSGHGWDSFGYISMVVSANYLSPFLLLAGFAVALRGDPPPLQSVLILFILPFAAYIAGLQWTIAYQPYYARYLLSEFVPYLLLLCVLAWSALDHGRARRALSVCLALGAFWMLALSAAQLGKVEARGASEALDRLVADMDKGDLLLLAEDASHAVGGAQAAKTALVYSYGLNVMPVGRDWLEEKGRARALDARFDDVYLISSISRPPDGFNMVRSVRYRVENFQHGRRPPTTVEHYLDSQVFLYMRGPELMTLEASEKIDFSSAGEGAAWLRNGWSNQESWGTWSIGGQQSLELDVRQLSADTAFDLVLAGRAYVTAAHPQQRIRVSINGEPVADAVVKYPQTVVSISSPLKPEWLQDGKLRLDLATPDAVSPKALGASADGRELALGLETIELKESARASATRR